MFSLAVAVLAATLTAQEVRSFLGRDAIRLSAGEGWEICAARQGDGTVAAGLFNTTNRAVRISWNLEKSGICCKWRITDAAAQEDIGIFLGLYETDVPAGAVQFLRLTPLPCGYLRSPLAARQNALDTPDPARSANAVKRNGPSASRRAGL